MKKTQSTLIILIIAIVFSSCTSLRYSNKRYNEVVQSDIVLRPDGETLSFEDLPSQEPATRGGALLTLMLGKAIQLSVQGVKKLIEKDNSLYTAEYQQARSYNYFYKDVSTKGTFDPSSIQFKGLTFSRKFVEKKTGKENLAVNMVMSISETEEDLFDMVNNSIFKLQIDSFDIQYSKAKIPALKWYTPWTLLYKNRQKLDLDLEVVFTASWVDDGGNIHHDEKIGGFIKTFREIPLSDPEALNAYCRQIEGSMLLGFSNIVPRSAGFYKNNDGDLEKGYGQGMYNVTIKVIESSNQKYYTDIIHKNVDMLDVAAEQININ